MAKAKARKAASPAKSEGNRSVVWLSGLACGALAAIAPGTIVVAAALLAPGLLALKLDREPGRPAARTVLTCGLAACVQPVVTLWNAGHSVDAAWAIASDPWVCGVAWAAAGAGWLLIQIAPPGVRMVLEAGALTRAARLRAMRARVAEAWGLEDAARPVEQRGKDV